MGHHQDGACLLSPCQHSTTLNTLHRLHIISFTLLIHMGALREMFNWCHVFFRGNVQRKKADLFCFSTVAFPNSFFSNFYVDRSSLWHRCYAKVISVIATSTVLYYCSWEWAICACNKAWWDVVWDFPAGVMKNLQCDVAPKWLIHPS